MTQHKLSSDEPPEKKSRVDEAYEREREMERLKYEKEEEYLQMQKQKQRMSMLKYVNTYCFQLLLILLLI